MDTSQYDNLPKRRNNDQGPEAVGLEEDRRNYMENKWWEPVLILGAAALISYFISQMFS